MNYQIKYMTIYYVYDYIRLSIVEQRTVNQLKDRPIEAHVCIPPARASNPRPHC